MTKHNIITILGGPGSGKGTVAAELMSEHDYTYIETGALFRAQSASSDIAKIMETGGLIPDEMVFPLIENETRVAHDILLDGFPRNSAQAKWMISHFNDAHITAIYLRIPESLMIERIHLRIAKGGNRNDDTHDEIVRRRLGTFERETVPMIEFLKTAPRVQFFEIDGTGTISEVFKEVKLKLGIK
ncbi:MAG: nucleoside monophosphate kinase [Alphaproteobacteria bacterium]|nr:nucleoside monophosphate kinase [Alphaproteobacteria bacterium]MCL2889752.1 nucleoside monophosphate kinase [Alphaproteobacteria bacterium]